MERITREGDRRIYQPRIHAERITELYKVKLITGLPLTVLVNEAISEFVEKYKNTEEWKKLTASERQQFIDQQLDQEFEYRRGLEEESILEEIDRWEDGSMYGF